MVSDMVMAGLVLKLAKESDVAKVFQNCIVPLKGIGDRRVRSGLF